MCHIKCVYFFFFFFSVVECEVGNQILTQTCFVLIWWKYTFCQEEKTKLEISTFLFLFFKDKPAFLFGRK